MAAQSSFESAGYHKFLKTTLARVDEVANKATVTTLCWLAVLICVAFAWLVRSSVLKPMVAVMESLESLSGAVIFIDAVESLRHLMHG